MAAASVGIAGATEKAGGQDVPPPASPEVREVDSIPATLAQLPPENWAGTLGALGVMGTCLATRRPHRGPAPKQGEKVSTKRER